MMQANRQLIGKRSHATGTAFEQIINRACQYYKELGIAVIEKTPEPMKVLGPLDKKHSKFIAVFVKQAQPDYKGTLCDGTSIIFEVKHTDSDRITEYVITDTQRDNFDLFEKMGAECYVMVSMGFQDFYRVPWRIFKSMKYLFGRKYMTKEELKPYKLQEKGLYLLILEGIELKDDSCRTNSVSI